MNQEYISLLTFNLSWIFVIKFHFLMFCKFIGPTNNNQKLILFDKLWSDCLNLNTDIYILLLPLISCLAN